MGRGNQNNDFIRNLPILDGTNYDVWRMKIMALFRLHGYSHLIEETKNKKEDTLKVPVSPEIKSEGVKKTDTKTEDKSEMKSDTDTAEKSEEMAFANLLLSLSDPVTKLVRQCKTVKGATQPLEVVHSDVGWCYLTPSLGGAQCFVTFVDDFFKIYFSLLPKIKRLCFRCICGF